VFALAWVVALIVATIVTGARPLRVSSPLPNFVLSACFLVFAAAFISPLLWSRARTLVLAPGVRIAAASRMLILAALLCGLFGVGLLIQGLRLWPT
jgi:hypothetical protein